MIYVGYYNGEIGPLEEMKIPMLDRAVYFGDGCYDATTFRNRRIFAEKDHFDRFYNSCRMLRIPFHLSREELHCELMKCIEATDADHGFLYWQCSRGTAFRGQPFPGPEIKPNLMAYTFPNDLIPFTKTYHLISVEDIRHHMCNAKTLNLLPNVLAADACVQAGCDEVVFYRAESGIKRVTECGHSNVLMLKDGVLISPPKDNLILPGITMGHLKKLAGTLGIPTEERVFTLEELTAADEIIISASRVFCHRAVTLDGKPVGGKDPENIKKLQNAYIEYYKKETES